MIFHDLFVIRSFPGSIEVLMPQSVTAGVSLEPSLMDSLQSRCRELGAQRHRSIQVPTADKDNKRDGCLDCGRLGNSSRKADSLPNSLRKWQVLSILHLRHLSCEATQARWIPV